jgi:hypothetical protein
MPKSIPAQMSGVRIAGTDLLPLLRSKECEQLPVGLKSREEEKGK